jgi:hypothetical protein
VPRVKGAGAHANPIDSFIAAGHEVRGLAANPEAPRRVRVRRLFLDLIGLPPSPEEAAAFEADRRPDAYERLVEQLLASPHYGERWGRHWLDVARWAESEGYESNHLRRYAWRYRDWVVASFNADRPFASFVRAQVAGDEMAPCTDENLVATGFLAAARLSSNEEDKRRQRNDVLVDVVNTTAGAFLGLTLGCAQCHNHKFDPLTARDYYRFQGFFVKGQPGNLELKDRTLWAKYNAVRPPEHEPASKLRAALFEKARRRLIAAARAKLSPEQRRALTVPPEKRKPEEERLADEAELKFQLSPNQVERAILPEDRRLYDELKKRLAALEKGLPDRPQTWGFYSPATAAARVEVLPMKGFYPLPYDPAHLARARAHLLIGGDVHRRGEALAPGWPAVFGPTPTLARPPRLALADWLSSPGNPLPARVWVNRLWGWHFGRGLVATPSDFGTRGAAPTHPELLDWLADEFVRSGGSTKYLQRLIVCSRTYRRSSAPHAGNARLDPDNAFLWRWQPRRLEAEVVRDAMLTVSGELDRTPGGQGDADEKKSRRRGLYLFQKRERPPALQGLFDGPSASAESCPRRHVSTVALQSLYLLNNDFAVGRARAFARRVLARAGTDRGKQVGEAFRLALGRAPDAAERAAVGRFFARHAGDQEPGEVPVALVQLCGALLNVNEFVYIE